MSEVELPCGCRVSPNHQRGDRRVRCATHGRVFVVTAQPAHITYETRELS